MAKMSREQFLKELEKKGLTEEEYNRRLQIKKKNAAIYNKLRKRYMQNRTRIQHFVYATRKRGYIIDDPIDIIGPVIPKSKVTRESVDELKQAIEELKSITPQSIYERSSYRDKSGAIIPATIAYEKEKLEQKEQARLRLLDLNKEKKSKKNKKENKAPSKKLQEAKEKAEAIREQFRAAIADFFKSVEDKAQEMADNAELSDEVNKAREQYYSPQTGREAGEGDGGYESSEAYVTLQNILEEIEVWEPMPYWSVKFSDIKRGDKDTLSSMLTGAIDSEGEITIAERLQQHASEAISLVQEILFGSGDKEYDLQSGRSKVQADIARMAAIIKGGPLTVEEARYLQDLQETQEY